MPTIELTEEQSRLLNGAADATVVDAGGRAYRLTPAGGDGPDDEGGNEDAAWRGPRPELTIEALREVASRSRAGGPYFTTEEVFAAIDSRRGET